MAEQPRSQDARPSVPPEAWRSFWIQLAHECRDEIKLLFQAKLGGKPRVVGKDDCGKDVWVGWRNVAEHQLGEAAAVEELGGALGLSLHQIERQKCFALIHDATKHLEKFRQKRKDGADMSNLPPSESFTPEEEAALARRSAEMRARIDPDDGLSLATSPEFMEEFFGEKYSASDPDPLPPGVLELRLRNIPISQLLQYYVDSIFSDGAIVPAMQFMDVREKRNAALNQDERRTDRLGRKYWDAEREAAPAVERFLWQRLRERGESETELPSPDHLPAFVARRIERRMVARWLEARGRRNVTLDLEHGQTVVEVAPPVCDTKREQVGKPAPHLNEDAGIVRQRGRVVLAGIFDGATNIGAPLPFSPGKAAAVACREAVAGASLHVSPAKALLRANDMLRRVAAGFPLTPEQRSEALSAVGAVARLDLAAMRLDIASVADCHVVVLHADGRNSWLTENTSKHCEILEIAAAVWAAQHPPKPAPAILDPTEAAQWRFVNPATPLPEDEKLLSNYEEVMGWTPDRRPALRPLKDPRVLEVIARNRRLENDLENGGQPSLKGGDDETFRHGIQEASVAVQLGDQIILFTDGGYPGPLYTKTQQSEVVAVLRDRGIEGLRSWVYEREAADPDLRDPPRMKQYDDLVALNITVK